jgi:ABC-type glycerol-3-phosphate transport system substrate-binding protein
VVDNPISMKKILILFLLISLLEACSSTKKTTTTTTTSTSPTTVKSDNKTEVTITKSKADGSSFEKAIILSEKTEEAGINAEYAWINNNYTGYSINGQAIKNYNGKHYDVFNITLADGTKKDIYFDISGFYGK